MEATPLALLPVGEKDQAYDELIHGSVVLIQRRWHAKLSARRREARAHRQRSREHSPLPPPADEKATHWASVDEATAHARAMQIQAAVRAWRQRELLRRTEAQILMQAKTFSEVRLATPAAAPKKKGAARRPSAPTGQQVLGERELADYVGELQARQARLRAEVQKLKVDRLYQPAETQKRTAVQMKEMQRQIKDLQNEIALAKSMAATASVAMEAEHAADAGTESAQRWKLSACRVMAASDINVPMALLPSLMVARQQNLLRHDCHVALSLKCLPKEATRPVASVQLLPEYGPGAYVELSDAQRGDGSVRVSIAPPLAGMSVRIVLEEQRLVAASLLVHPPKAAEFQEKRRVKKMKQQIATVLQDPRIQASVTNTALMKFQRDSDVAGDLLSINRLLKRMRQVEEEIGQLRLHERMSERTRERISQQLEACQRRLELFTQVGALNALAARKKKVKAEMATLYRRSTQLQNFCGLLVLMVQLLQDERKMLLRTAIRRLLRKHVSLVERQSKVVNQIVHIQQVVRGRQARSMCTWLRNAVQSKRDEKYKKSRRAKVRAFWLASATGVAYGARSTRRTAAAMIIQRHHRVRLLDRFEHDEAVARLSSVDRIRRMWNSQLEPARRQAQIERLVAIERLYQLGVGATRKFDPFLRESDDPEAAVREAAATRQAVEMQVAAHLLTRGAPAPPAIGSTDAPLLPSWDRDESPLASSWPLGDGHPSPFKRPKPPLTARPDLQRRAAPPAADASRPRPRAITPHPPAKPRPHVPRVPSPRLPSPRAAKPAAQAEPPRPPRPPPRPHVAGRSSFFSPRLALRSDHCGPVSPLVEGAFAQTKDAHAELEARENEALQRSLERLSTLAGPSADLVAANCRAIGTSVAETIRLARIAAAPAPSVLPERVSVERVRLFEAKRNMIDDDSPIVRSAGLNRKLASLWEDGSFSSTTVKQTRAEVEAWRKQQDEWRRARGLRRELLLRDQERKVVELQRAEREVARMRARMRLAEQRDSAAMRIQDAWRVYRTVVRQREELESVHALRVMQRRALMLSGRDVKADDRVQQLMRERAAKKIQRARRESVSGFAFGVACRETSFDQLRQLTMELHSFMMPIAGKAFLETRAALKVQRAYKAYRIAKAVRDLAEKTKDPKANAKLKTRTNGRKNRGYAKTGSRVKPI